jgi:hypothetical protein
VRLLTLTVAARDAGKHLIECRSPWPSVSVDVDVRTDLLRPGAEPIKRRAHYCVHALSSGSATTPYLNRACG